MAARNKKMHTELVTLLKQLHLPMFREYYAECVNGGAKVRRVLTSQCLKRRIGDKQKLKEEVAQWQYERNFLQAKVDWRFSTDNARIKLKRLYPTLLT